MLLESLRNESKGKEFSERGAGEIENFRHTPAPMGAGKRSLLKAERERN